MFTRKLVTLALSMVLSGSVFAGTESGGGGDAVTRNDQLILRDFLEDSTFETVLDNEKFLKGVPDFSEIVAEIMVQAPYFASDILEDLFRVNLIFSKSKLPLLSSSKTTVSGTKADVQLAIRMGDTIYLSPEVKKASTKDLAYLFIHESLHALILKDQNNALKHQKIRTIVKYLKDNRGKYTPDLNTLIYKLDNSVPYTAYVINNDSYKLPELSEMVTTKFAKEAILNKKLEKNIRCYWSYIYLKNHTSDMSWLQDLNCSGKGSDREELISNEYENTTFHMNAYILKNLSEYESTYLPFFDIEEFRKLSKVEVPSYPTEEQCISTRKELNDKLILASEITDNYKKKAQTLANPDNLPEDTLERFMVKTYLQNDVVYKRRVERAQEIQMMFVMGQVRKNYVSDFNRLSRICK